jgi:hypothetical protein
MVAMVVSDQDIGQTPSLFFQSGQNGGFFACIDAGGFAGFRIMQQHPEIIGSDQKLMKEERHLLPFSVCRPYIDGITRKKEAV